MSKIALEGNASGTGTFTIASPNSNSNYTLTLPSSTGTVVVTGGAQTIEFAAGTAAAPSITFTGDTNTGIFSPGADTIAFSEGGVESMRIDSSGNVGIGYTTPSSMDAGARNLVIGGGSGNTGATIFSGTSSYGSLHFADGTTGSQAYRGYIWYFHTDDALGFGTAGTERMRIDSSGNVGIGVTPDTWSTNFKAIQLGSPKSAVSANTNTNQITLWTNAYVGTDGNPKYSGTGATSSYFALTNDGGFQWHYAASGTAGNNITYTERARITSGGDLLVGTTTANGRISIETGNDECIWMKNTWGANGGTLVLWNNAGSGNNYFQGFFVDAAAALVGSIDYNRGAGLTRFNTTSDATLKNIIGDADSQLSIDILNTTRVREFAWKNDPTQKPQVGVIAQELYETYKGAVSVGGDFERERDVTEEVEEEYTDEEGNTQTRTVTKVVGKETYTEYRPWGVDKTAFTFHLIAGWQAHEKLLKEAMTRIEALEAEVAALKGQ